MTWESSPHDAWVQHILPHAKEGWVEDSSNISNSIAISKRELFSLILLAQARSSEGTEWKVGYNANDPEPNDGFVTDGNQKLYCEHKVVAKMEKPNVLDLILERYKKFAALTEAYGKGRVFIIHPNKGSVPIKISDLTKEIEKDECPFDAVFTLGCVADYGRIKVMHLVQHYPYAGLLDNKPAMSQVDFDTSTGNGDIKLHNIKFD